MRFLLLGLTFGLALTFGPATAPVSAQVPTQLCITTTANPRACQPVDGGNPLPTSGGGLTVPSGSTAVSGNATGTTGAVVGTLAAASGLTNYLCSFDVSAVGGTAAVGPITVAGTLGGSLVYQLASSATGTMLSRTFTPCIAASAANTAITITTTADGTATAVSVNSQGFRK